MWLMGGASLGAAQATNSDSVTVTPGPEYSARPFRSAMIGAGWRDLWLTPIRVPVLDLAHFAGGLTPIDTDGGQRTIALHMRGTDGVEYDLRPVDPAPILKMVCRNCADRPIDVLISASNPAAELIVAPLLQAAGVAHADPRFVVIPNDPRLGPYRHEFAGVLCLLQARHPGITTDSLRRIVTTSATQAVDARAYLTARLMDMYVGDWNRGPMQWRWTGGPLWEPVSIDHRLAFQRSDGLLPSLARRSHPELVAFGDHYPSLIGLTAHEWFQDRRIVQDLERPAFDSIAHVLQGALTDAVIEHAVAQMPPEFRARAPELIHALERRRDQLASLADQYYRLLALGADVYTKALPTRIEVTRSPDTIAVRMVARSLADGADSSYFIRRFARSTTAEIRLYLEGGPDRVTIHGGGDGITLRIIGAAPLVVDSGSGRTLVYTDKSSPNTGPGQMVREEGHDCHVWPSLNAGSGAGSVIGLTFTCDEFGFRRTPWAYSNAIGIGYETAAGGVVADYLGQIRSIGSRDVFSLHLLAVSSQFEWFYGEGNQAVATNDTAFSNNLHHGEPDFRIRESYFQVAPAFTMPLVDHATLTLSPYLRYWQTTRMGSFVDSVRPYGVGPFGTVGGIVDAEYDSRDNPGYATRGINASLVGRGVPAVWSAVSPYGTLQGSVATYLTPPIFPLHPTLALRVGGDKVWGDAPYQDLADVGGPAYAGANYAVRGGLPDRYTGQASAYGNAQLEIPLARARILLPVTIGVLGLNDVGRVFVPGETDSQWQDGYGGGIFVAPLGRLTTFSVTIVHSTDGTRVYFGYGTGF
jgi:hypothetical protein